MARPTFPVLTDDDGSGLTGTIINNAKYNEIKNYITKGLELKNLTELTIAAGVITITEVFHTVDTEADAGSDDLDTISGGTTGAILVIKPANDARTVVVKHNTGNIWLKGQADLSLDDLEDGLLLIYTGSKWIDLGAGGAGGGADVRIRAYGDTNQENIADDTPTKIQLNQESYDPDSDFDHVTNYRFTAPVAGYYTIIAIVFWTTVVVDKRFYTYIYKNGALISSSTAHSSFGYSLSVIVADTVYLAANDYIEEWAKHYAGDATPDIEAGSTLTYLAIHSQSEA